jgi:hypothetical protein
VTNTLKYLEACNKIFRNGLLRHKRITDMNSDVLRAIEDGYTFFSEWICQILQESMHLHFSDPDFNHSSPAQRSFLAW